MSEYRFTKDWFNWAPAVWEQLIPMLPAREAFLEIGSFEGRSAVWTIENLMEDGGYIDCIDTWEGGGEHKAGNEDMGSAEERFDYNMALATKGTSKEYAKLKGSSTNELASMLPCGNQYDFIYIDGSHTAPDVLTDACMAWPMLKPKGIMVFDDYLWGDPRDALHRPKIAIDAFTNIFGETAEIVHVGYQLVVRKK